MTLRSLHVFADRVRLVCMLGLLVTCTGCWGQLCGDNEIEREHLCYLRPDASSDAAPEADALKDGASSAVEASSAVDASVSDDATMDGGSPETAP